MSTQSTLEIRNVKEGIWNFVEMVPGGHQIDAYLICGREKAIMFDTMQTVRGVYEKARELTQLPIEVVISHGHGDHYGAATEEFIAAGCPVYLNQKDRDVLTAFGMPLWPEGHFRDLEDGQVFDLGGRVLKTMLLPGHTPAGDVLLDQEEGLLFTGDAIGSGQFWMQLSTCTTLEELLPGVERLLSQVKAWNKEALILPGHRYQAPVPMGLSYIEDLASLVRGLIDGSLQGEAMTMSLHGEDIPCASIRYGGVEGMLYNPQRVRK